MGYITEFQYSEPEKRKYIYINSLISFIIAGILCSSFISLAEAVFPYHPYYLYIILCALIAFAAGTRTGHLLFGRFRNFRLIYAISELVLISASCIFFLRTLIPGDIFFFSEPLLDLYFIYPLLFLVLPGVAFFSLGVKTAYLLKLSSGEFIDNRNGVLPLTYSIISGLFIGFAIYPVMQFSNLYNYIPETFFAIFPILLLPSIYFINLPYNPVSLYAKVFEKTTHEENNLIPVKENLFFIYLNSSFIIIYIYLSCVMLTGFTNELYYLNIAVFSSILLLLMTGSLLGQAVKIRSYYSYAGAIFAPLFIAAAYLLTLKTETGNIIWGLILSPVILLFGFILNHHIRLIVSRFSYKLRFRIIDILLLILPFPLLIPLLLINFSYTWFFVTIYALSFTNLMIPAINITGKNIKPALKFLCFLFILITIPAVILIHVSLEIPMSGHLIKTPVKGYEQLRDINYNSPYISRTAELEFKETRIFHANDSIIRNLKRAIVPVALYAGSSTEKHPLLFIDGNQKFFRNPVIGLFRDFTVIDPVSEWAVSYRMLPVSGRQRYVAENRSTHGFFADNNNRYSIIIDIHNLYDQNQNLLKFTEDYHPLIKQHLTEDGIYAGLINLNGYRKDFLLENLNSLENSFSFNLIFMFSDIMLIISSDSEERLEIDIDGINNLTSFINENSEISRIFYNEYHLLSRLLFLSIPEFRSFILNTEETGITDHYFLPGEEMTDHYLNSNKRFLELISSETAASAYYNRLSRYVSSMDNNLALLKNFELSESQSGFESETEYLFQLNKNSQYIPELSRYIKSIMKYKESYYADIALEYENQRKWREAQQLYHAMLVINRNNLDANYRLGRLYLMLQDIDKSFIYLKKALELDSENPEVLYQVGMLHFSNGKFHEAIDFFNSALQYKKRSASIHKYLGLSYKEINDLNNAEKHLNRGLILNPNDHEIIYRLEEIKAQRELWRSSWSLPPRSSELDVEKGIELDIPINRSAYHLRLEEEEPEN